MRILYIEPDYTGQSSYGYYYKTIESISRHASVQLVAGKGYKTSVEEIKRRIPDLDLICFGFGWMNVWKNGVHYIETIIEGIEDTDIPKAVFLNKEYGGGLASKLGWIKEIKADFALTYHHDYKLFEKITGVPFYFIPFAADPALFKNYGIDQVHDIGFTGGLGHVETNGWEKKSEFGKLIPFKAEGQGWSHNLRREVKEKHSSWPDINFYFSNHRHDSVVDYAKRLNTAKMWLSTTGPVDIVGTRYYEVMLTGTTLLMCNRSNRVWCFDENLNRCDRDINVYEDLFEEDVHYVAFDSVTELEDKVKFYKDNEDARLKIVKNAYDHAIKHHTWDNRAESFLKAAKKHIRK